MALSYGFYNSVDGDRKYDAIQFGSIFDGIIKDGVYGTYLKGMIVIASSNAGEVIIQPGRAWFNHTWSYNDANLPFEAPAPEVLLDRIDALVLEINEELAYRQNSFKWVLGTPASQNPQRPTLTNTTTVHQYPLCYIHRYPETTTIQPKDITNAIGTSETPFATGVLQGIDLDAWINQWDDEFHTWENATKSDFTQWRTTEQNEWTAWRTQEQTSFEAWMLTQQTVYDAWFTALKTQMDTDVADVEAWVETIKDIIDSQTASHLQAEIDDLKTWTPNGSYFDITTQEPELFSRAVTVSDLAGHTQSVNFDSSGHAVIKSYPYIGNLTITSTDGIRTATYPISVPYFGRFDIELSFWRATVQIEGSEELESGTVTVKNSDDVTVAVVTLNASAEGTFNATYPDTYKFIAYYEGETTEEEVEVLEETTYTVELAFWRAIVNIDGDEEYVGQTVTVTDSNEVTVGSVILDSSGDGVFKAKKPDTYKFSLTYGGQTMEVSLAVTQETTYNVELHGGFRWNTWLEAGGLDPDNYDTLDEVLADEAALRRLFIVHASVDYLANADIRGASALADVTKIFNTDLAAKWINLSDYALDTFYAVTDIKSIMDTADKYGYGEWALMPQIPIMTSNTAPIGECICSGVSDYCYPYKAFNMSQASENCWWHNSSGSWLGYKFINAVCVKRISIQNEWATPQCLGNYKVQASNDNVTWVDLAEFTETEQVAGKVFEHEIDNDNSYLMYRFAFASATSVQTAQFYAWGPKGNVPSMTSDTTPYGVSSASSTFYYNGSNYATTWGAFTQYSGGSPYYWAGGAASSWWHRYKFVNPVKVKRFKFITIDDGNRQWTGTKLQASNDAINWTDLYIDYDTTVAKTEYKHDIDNDNYYLYYQIVIDKANSDHSHSPGFHFLQYYGREMSVSVPTMTSNTAPYGEVIYSSATDPWKVFDGVKDTSGSRNYALVNNITQSTPQYIGYHFTCKIVPKMVIEVQDFDGGSTYWETGSILGSNDNSNNDNLLSITDHTGGASKVSVYELNTTNEYEYLKLQINYGSNLHQGSIIGISNIYFYGLDYSEKEFEVGTTKKWLYDHGVEVEAITTNATGTEAIAIELPDSLQLYGGNGTQGSAGATAYTGSLDLTSYNLMRAKIGYMLENGNGATYPGLTLTVTSAAPNYSWTSCISYKDYAGGDADLPNDLFLDISSIDTNAIPTLTEFVSANRTNRKAETMEWWLE